MGKKTTVIFSILIALVFILPILVAGCADEGDDTEISESETAAPTFVDSHVSTGNSKNFAMDTTDYSKVLIAKVNGHEITGEEFEREMERLTQIYLKVGAAPGQNYVDLKKLALNNLISQELVIQECEKTGLVVDQEMMENELKRIFPQKEAFFNYLVQANITEEAFRRALHEKIAIQNFVKENFIKTLTIPDEEIKAFYDRHQRMFIQPEVVHASHILITVDRDATEKEKEEARKKIEEVQRKLKEGGDFAALAKEYSDCPSKNRGGDLGYFGRNKMVESFENAAFSTPVGGISPIVETPFGFHIIKVDDKKERHLIPFEAVRDQIRQRMERQKVNDELDQYIAGIRDRSDVEILVNFDQDDQHTTAYHPIEREEINN